MPDSLLNTPLYQDCGFDPIAFREFSKKTQIELFNWFRQALSVRSDYVIIYRPHPAEIGACLLDDMQRENPSFHVVSNLSVKQWILVADKIYTWISTSIAEVYAASKGCNVLRPFPIPHAEDIPIYNNASFISDYRGFEESLVSNSEVWAVPPSELEEFYFSDAAKPSYLLACDVLEEVIDSDEFRHEAFRGIRYSQSVRTEHGIIAKMRSAANRTTMFLLRFELFQRLVSQAHGRKADTLRERVFALKMAEKNKASRKEISDIQRRIGMMIEGNDPQGKD